MTGALESWRVPRRVLLLSGVVTLVMLVPLAGAYTVAGLTASLGIVMGYITGSRPALLLPPRSALGLALLAAMTGAVAVGLRGQPVPAACFVALCCLLVAPASMLSEALMAGVPTTAAVLVAAPGDFQPGPIALWMLAGSAVVVLLGRWLHTPGQHPAGVLPARAWRHAIVMAVAVGVAVYVVESLDWPHGYWIALTLTVILRPFDDQTLTRSWQRVLGTLGGVLLSVVLAGLLPLWGLAVAVLGCQVLNLAYTVKGDYPRQVLFLTPTVILLGSASADALAAERAAYTLIGALLAGSIAVALAWYDRSRTKEVPTP